MSLNGSAQSIGSPSRMRGKEGDELGLGQTIRITPAYAGKSKSLPSLHIGSRDHPRVCGEKHCTSTPIALVSGSPPHVRGKVQPERDVQDAARITPAYAGKSMAHLHPACVGGDHPRVCGEKPLVSFVADFSRGSPPRMRGKGSGTLPHYDHQGITPACAGKSLKLSSRTTGRRDHPRVCGEKRVQLGHVLAALGSPPRMRGKAVHHKHRHSPGRITPACAGKVNVVDLSSGAYGITPAYAGKRSSVCPASPKTRDHPRMCGEKMIWSNL